MAPTTAPLVRFFLYAVAPITAPPTAPTRIPVSLPVNGVFEGPKPSCAQPASTMPAATPAARCFFIILPPLRCCPLQNRLSPGAQQLRALDHGAHLAERDLARQV